MQNHPNAMWQRRKERRGWITTAIAAIPAVTGTYSSLTQNQQDPQRFATAQAWYRAAMAGDKDAQCALKHMSGRYGCATCGQYGQACGFATQAAKTYCGQLYDQFVQQQSGVLSPNAPIPSAPSAQPAPPVTITAQTGTGPGGTGGGVTIQAGSSPPPTATEQTSKTLNFLLIGALAVAALVFFSAMRRRG